MQETKKKETFKILIVAGLIVFLSSAIGVLANISLVNRIINSECITPTTSPREASQIDLAEAKKKFDGGEALFIDARCPDEYNQGHIKGAISLPPDKLELECPLAIVQLPRESEIITYCEGGTDCQLSTDLAKKLIVLGYLNVNDFFGGWPAWESAGYPIDPEN
ncbi:MAG: rhodanese-like domain-containing protein [Deltaproteobacteria bacterium]|nr:MAG: rhodanese-like domain-containing protein [Deltaproteobacteria bacterium]